MTKPNKFETVAYNNKSYVFIPSEFFPGHCTDFYLIHEPTQLKMLFSNAIDYESAIACFDDQVSALMQKYPGCSNIPMADMLERLTRTMSPDELMQFNKVCNESSPKGESTPE